MGDAVLEVTGLTKKIKDKAIVDTLSLQISPGEVVGFVGPNGAGKTTTMRMIVGLVSPTAGEINIKGKNIQKDFVKAMDFVGGVIEGPQLYSYLSGYQNLRHYARMVNGVTKERISEIVSLVGLTSRIHEKVKNYSLGMRQRLGLAQALLHSPALLVLDEPTNGLDPGGIREINTYLRKLADEQGVSIFVSSHILSEMEQVCDRILFIKNGQVIDEHQMSHLSEATGLASIEFIVDPLEKARELLSNMYPENKVVVNENRITIDIEPHLIAETNKKLVENDIAVSGMRVVTKRLEDRYTEVTGGKTEC